MTPLQLSVLLHYYANPGASPPFTISDIAEETAQMFVKEDMLEGAGDFYSTTEKGEFFVRFILNLPFPVSQYEIPEIKPRG